MTAALAVLAALTILAQQPAQAATIVEVTNFGSNPGNLQMFKYVPDNLPANSPLVVAMHGASSDHTLMSDVTGWQELADRHQFALALPQQKSANQTNKAFNFNTAQDATRGNGEILSIKQMVDYMEANHGVDPGRTFATGFSAGGFMTTVALATYPDVFEAGHIYAGGAYQCTKAVSECGGVVQKTPEEWGDIVRAQNPGYTGPWPRVSVGQGDADNLADFEWMQEIVDEWTNVHGTDQTADVSDTVKGYPHKVYNDSAGNPVVETITIPGLTHKMAVDPGTAEDQCGSVSFIASEDVDMCIAHQAAVWFGITDAEPPPTTTTTTAPPTTTTTAPPGGTTVTFDNVDANDGYVKANTDGTSPEVGGQEASTGLAMGKSTIFPYKHMRTVLSFDTSSIPDGASITRAYVTVQHKLTGGNAWNDPVGNTLVIDVKTGCLGGSCSIGTDDWSAAVTQASAASIPHFSSGTIDSSDFISAGMTAINKTGTTQFKLRFSQFQQNFNYVTIVKGTAAHLTVVYQ